MRPALESAGCDKPLFGMPDEIVVSIITAARKRFRREQIEGADDLTDCWTDKSSPVVKPKTGFSILDRVARLSKEALGIGDAAKPADSPSWLKEHIFELTTLASSCDVAEERALKPIIAKLKERLGEADRDIDVGRTPRTVTFIEGGRPRRRSGGRFSKDVADDDDEPPEVTPRVVIPVAIAEAQAAAQPQGKPRGTAML